MAALKEIAYWSRLLIKAGLFIFVGFFVIKFILKTSLNLWNRLHPPPPPAPTVSFGKLPEIKFPSQEKYGGLEYKLETPDGQLPSFPDKLKVFFIPYQRPNLLALDRAKDQAASLSFKDDPVSLSDKEYEWTKIDFDKTTFKMDIFSGVFEYTYTWQNDQQVLASINIAGKEEVKQNALSFINQAAGLESDIANGRVEVDYLKLEANELLPAISLSEAGFAKVEVFRQNIEELPVFTPNPKKGIVSLLLASAGGRNNKTLKVEYNYFPIKYDSWGTYPIKSAASAFEELKKGSGHIASWDQVGNKIIIRRVYLAYYDSYEPQEFLQPIVVFEGDNNFFGYIPSITADWY